MTATVAAAILPAFADELPNRFRKGDSWCERHAKTMVEVQVAEEVGLVVGAGTYLDRPVTSAYGCYDLTVADERRGELVSAWLDGEDGEAGITCVKQASPKSCKRTAFDVPVEATTPMGHPGEQWWLQVLGFELHDGVDGGVVSVRTGGAACVPGAGTCTAVPRHSVSAAPEVRYRALGYECGLSDRTCARNQAGDGVAVGEPGGPLLAVDQATLDGPDLCVDVAVDPRC